MVAVGIALVGAAVPATAKSHGKDDNSGGGANKTRGPYAVGRRSYTFVDPSRPTERNGTYAGAPTRTLPTIVLYPAKGDPSAPLKDNAPPLRKGPDFPLIVFSHGVGASGPAYTPVLQRLVRAGYVVAAPTFPLSNGGAPGGSTIRAYVNQPADVSFVLTRVLRLAGPRGKLRRTVARGRIGVAGHSLGAITTLGLVGNSCCGDRRIDAAVAWSGIQLPFPNGRFFTTPTPPLLLVHGTTDPIVPYAGSQNAYRQAPAPKAFVSLEKAGHIPFVSPWADPTINSTTDFLDRYLKRDRKALKRLVRDANVPGVAHLDAVLPGCRSCASG
jgi:dienelactone hydrolase